MPAKKPPAPTKTARTRPAARKKPSVSTAAKPLSVLMVASEAHPFAKTGGLAEVAGSLSDALARLGHSVTLVLPRYRGADAGGGTGQTAAIQIGWRSQDVTFYK